MPRTPIVKGFVQFCLLKKAQHFECRTFDLSDNSPCIFQSYFHRQKSFKEILGRKAGEKAKNYSIFNFENPFISRISGGRNDQAALKFRVRPERPLRYAFVYSFCLCRRTTLFRLPRYFSKNKGFCQHKD